MAERYRPLFQFCPECNMMLQANEDVEIKQLIYRCRNCTYQRPVELPAEGLLGGAKELNDDFDPAKDVSAGLQRYVGENCVHRRDITYIAKEDIIVPEGVMNDPSLARNYNYTCEFCPSKTAVFYKLADTIVPDAMALVFVCCGCGNWRKEGKEEVFRAAMGTEGGHGGETAV